MIERIAKTVLGFIGFASIILPLLAMLLEVFQIRYLPESWYWAIEIGLKGGYEIAVGFNHENERLPTLFFYVGRWPYHTVFYRWLCLADNPISIRK